MGLADLPAVSFEDDLTGLYNRRFLQRYLATQVDWKADAGTFSFLVVDLDEFHRANDLYGHAEGDFVLQGFADRLKKTFRSEDVIARDGGDSFFVVLPGVPKAEAVRLAQQVVQDVVKSPLRTRRDRFPVELTASAGVVSFPEDGRQAETIRDAADKVLFHAKRAGRNRVSVGGQIDELLAAERDVFAGLPCRQFCGRQGEFQAALGVLDELAAGRPSVLFVQGPAGIGKSRFLREMGDVATARDILYLFAICNESQRQSLGYALIYLVDQYYRLNPDSQQDLYDCLFPAQRRVARELIASLSSWKEEDVEISPRDRKPLLLGMLETAVLAMARRSPLLILLDNARHCDRGTLDVLQRILRDRRAPVAVFLSVKGDVRKMDPKTDPGLHSIVDELQRGGNMQALTLVPLGREDVSHMVQAILPNSNVTRDFEELLYVKSVGNPLYVEEAVRALILRERIVREGERYVVPRIATDELPASLDAVIEQVLSTLSPEAGELVTNAAIIGSRFDIQVLQEVMGKREGETLDAVDQVAGTKLIEHLERGSVDDYAFRSSTARDVRYTTTADDARKLMHRRLSHIARAQSIRTPDRFRPERNYHLQASGQAIPAGEEYDDAPVKPSAPARAVEVIGRVPRVPEGKDALKPEAVRNALDFMRALAALLRIGRLYPQWSQTAAQFTKQIHDACRAMLEASKTVTFAVDSRGLAINGQYAENIRAGDALSDFNTLLTDRLIASLTLTQGLGVKELDDLVAGLGAPMNRSRLPPDHWDKFLDNSSIRHADILQKRYVAREGERGARLKRRELPAPRTLSHEELDALRDALRNLKAAMDNLRLYPPGHALVEESHRETVSSLGGLVERLKVLVLAAADNGLLVNGQPTDARGVGDAGMHLADQLSRRELKSLTLTEGLRAEEVQALVSIFAVPAEDPQWKKVLEAVVTASESRNFEFGGLLYTQIAAAAEGVVPAGIVKQTPAPTPGAPAPGAEFRAASPDAPRRPGPPPRPSRTPAPTPTPSVPRSSPSGDDPTPRYGTLVPGAAGGATAEAGMEEAMFTGVTVRADVRARAYLKAGPDRFLGEEFEHEFGPLMEVLNYGWAAQLGGQLVGRLVDLARDENPPFRIRALAILGRGLADTASPDARGPVVSRSADMLGSLIATERAPDVMLQLADTVGAWINAAFALGRYDAAADILGKVRRRLDAKTAPPEFKERLTTRLQELGGPKGALIGAIRTVAPSMREAALRLCGMFGASMVRPLVDLIGETDDPAARRLAALALKEIGPNGGAELAKLVTSDGPVARVERVLAALELTGAPLAGAVNVAVEHPDPAVRAAAFGMLKRADKAQAVTGLRKLVGSDRPELSLSAISLAGECGLGDLAMDVARVAQASAEEAVLRACCGFFVRVKSAAALPALWRIFESRSRMFGLVKGISDETRAMAVKAAAAITHPEAAELVDEARRDKSAEVRRAAGTGL